LIDQLAELSQPTRSFDFPFEEVFAFIIFMPARRLTSVQIIMFQAWSD